QPGNYLVKWAAALSGSNSPNVLTVTNASPVVTALFGPLPVGQYALTLLSQGTGSVSAAPSNALYASGTLVALTAIPGPGQSFLGWSGDASGAQNPLNATMNQ